MKSLATYAAAAAVALGCVDLHAAAQTVRLPCVAGSQETYFLPLGELGADASTMTLKTPSGEPVPFSFDARIEFPEVPGKLRKPANGYSSYEVSPAADDAYRQMGWLSFKAPRGVSEVVLFFVAGGGPTEERPDPSCRTWWVELLKNSPLKDPVNGWRLKGTVTVPWKDFADPAPMPGRRLLSLSRTFAPEGVPRNSFYCVRLPNASAITPSANGAYFSPRAEGADCLVEGFVKASRPIVVNAREAMTISSSYISNPSPEPVVFKILKVQSPPHVRLLGAKLISDLFNVGDEVEISLPKGRGEVLVPFESSGISGERVVNVDPSAKVSSRCRLIDRGGNCLRDSVSESVSLAGVKPGKYTIEVSIFADGAHLSTCDLPIKVQRGPDWGRPPRQGGKP